MFSGQMGLSPSETKRMNEWGGSWEGLVTNPHLQQIAEIIAKARTEAKKRAEEEQKRAAVRPKHTFLLS